MYGSYGSYGSYSCMPMPMPISTGSNRHDSWTSQDSCAFPSWPRRSSLSDSDHEEHASSYLSDEDLFLPDPFEDEPPSVSSSSASSSSASPSATSPPQCIIAAPPEPVDLVALQREHAGYRREVLRLIAQEKERRRQEAARRSRRSGGAKRGVKVGLKLAAMTPIAEAAAE